MNEDPRPEDTYLAFVLRQVAPKAKRLAVWAARVTAVLLVILVVPPAGRWVNQRLTALWTEWRKESPQPPPVVTANYQIPRNAPDHRVASDPVMPVTVPATTPSAPAIAPIRPRAVAQPAPEPARVVARVTPSPRPLAVSIPEGTAITVALVEEIGTDRNGPGDTFKAILVDDLVSDGHVIARAQTEVRGRITEIQRGSRSENPTITLELDSLEGTNGLVSLNTLPLTIEGKRQSKAKKFLKGIGGAVAGAVVGGELDGKKGAMLGAGLGTIVAIKGDSLALPAASVSRFQLSRAVALNQPE